MTVDQVQMTDEQYSAAVVAKMRTALWMTPYSDAMAHQLVRLCELEFTVDEAAEWINHWTKLAEIMAAEMDGNFLDETMWRSSYVLRWLLHLEEQNGRNGHVRAPPAALACMRRMLDIANVACTRKFGAENLEKRLAMALADERTTRAAQHVAATTPPKDRN